MLLAATKMIDVLARAAFTVGLTFMLPLAVASKFGLLVTLVGLFAFAFGWERHIDVQRRLIGVDGAVFDYAVLQMTRLWLVNYLWMLPLFLLVLLCYAAVPPYLAALVLIIAICEQVGNSAYNVSVVERRYLLLVVCVAAKNLVLLLLSIALILFFPARLSLSLVLEYWAGVSLIATFGIALTWWTRHKSLQGSAPAEALSGFWVQHRASLTHFLTGLLAVLILQIDRLVVGGFVSAEQAGIYFRHIMLVAFAYQFFNVASYNRRMPEILSLARDAGIGPAQQVVRRESLLVCCLIVLGFIGATVLDYFTDQRLTARWHIAISLLGILLLAAQLRIFADFQALILNARLREKRVLQNQMLAFGIGIILLIALTVTYGIYGTALATLASATLYLILSLVATRTLDTGPIGAKSS